jgi:hypothetical protein
MKGNIEMAGIGDCKHGPNCKACNTVYYCGDPFGVIVDEKKLTKKQLCEAIDNYGRCVVLRPNGAYNMLDPESNEYVYGPDDPDEEQEAA